MTEMLKLDGSVFTTGRAVFSDRDPTGLERTAKIFVTVEFPGVGQSLAQLDTGSPWSVLEYAVAELLGVIDGDGEEINLRTNRGIVTGRLERVQLVLVAEDGPSLKLEATFLVSQNWTGKTFLGYSGLLDRIRIALDPSTNSFFFGAIDRSLP